MRLRGGRKGKDCDVPRVDASLDGGAIGPFSCGGGRHNRRLSGVGPGCRPVCSGDHPAATAGCGQIRQDGHLPRQGHRLSQADLPVAGLLGGRSVCRHRIHVLHPAGPSRSGGRREPLPGRGHQCLGLGHQPGRGSRHRRFVQGQEGEIPDLRAVRQRERSALSARSGLSHHTHGRAVRLRFRIRGNRRQRDLGPARADPGPTGFHPARRLPGCRHRLQPSQPGSPADRQTSGLRWLHRPGLGQVTGRNTDQRARRLDQAGRRNPRTVLARRLRTAVDWLPGCPGPAVRQERPGQASGHHVVQHHYRRAVRRRRHHHLRVDSCRMDPERPGAVRGRRAREIMPHGSARRSISP